MGSGNKKRHALTDNGFTLMEVMITLFVLSVGLLAVGSMQIKSAQINDSAFCQSRANALAQGKVEELVAMDWHHVQLTDDDPALYSVTSYEEPNFPEGYRMTWDVDVDNPSTGMKCIRVWVTWTEKGYFNRTTGRRHEREIQLVFNKIKSL